VAKNANADNDYWEEYQRLGKDFRGDPEDIEDMVVGEDDNPKAIRKRKFETEKFSHHDGNSS
jgi:hypothetical protein|tara:strand:+ start:361 stop:546 length:186 start_codon:yes stop_codon:yes gene_type:complete